MYFKAESEETQEFTKCLTELSEQSNLTVKVDAPTPLSKPSPVSSDTISIPVQYIEQATPLLSFLV